MLNSSEFSKYSLLNASQTITLIPGLSLLIIFCLLIWRCSGLSQKCSIFHIWSH